MSLKENGLDCLFFVGRATPELVIFARALTKIGTGEGEWKRLRTPESNERMIAEHQLLGGMEDVARAILNVMGDQDLKFIPNLYPYDALLVGGLVHTCLWNRKGELTKSEMIHAVNDEFGPKSSLVFVNALERKSVHQIWHSHVIVHE